MRVHHGFLRAGLFAALASPTVACNAVLGVNDVSLASPDARPPSPDTPPPPDATPCEVDPHFQLVSSGSSPSSLIHLSAGGGPSVLILVNSDMTKPDGLFIQLYNDMGQHGILNAPGTYQLTAADATLATCGICAFFAVNIDRNTNTWAQTYFALGMGDLTLTTASATRLTGSMHNLQLRHVDTTSGATDPDGCVAKIDTVEFDLAYTP